jgi:hypothetical protein
MIGRIFPPPQKNFGFSITPRTQLISEFAWNGSGSLSIRRWNQILQIISPSLILSHRSAVLTGAYNISGPTKPTPSQLEYYCRESKLISLWNRLFAAFLFAQRYFFFCFIFFN